MTTEIDRLIERLRRTKTQYWTRDVLGCVSIQDETESREVPVNPDGPEAADQLELLREALRPFAAHIGKDGSWVELKIGGSTWTNTLSTDDFRKARAALTQTGASPEDTP